MKQVTIDIYIDVATYEEAWDALVPVYEQLEGREMRDRFKVVAYEDEIKTVDTFTAQIVREGAADGTVHPVVPE